MGTFGDPITGNAAEGTGAAEEQKVNGATPSDEAQNLLDPNDPRLVSEELNANPDADAYAQPAPPPDGKYRVKLKLAKKKSGNDEVDFTAALWGKAPGQAVFVLGIEAGIIDPTGKYDGLKAYDFNVSTFVGRDNATKVTTVLSKLRRPDGTPWVVPHTRLSPKGWIELLVKALAGEPELGIESQWEYSCADCGKAAKASGNAYPKSVNGMHKFPEERDKAKRSAGQLYSPEMKCPLVASHGYGRARISIARFLSLDELKK
jgi:hypothetical protein